MNDPLQLRRDIRACRACPLGKQSHGPTPPTFPDRYREPRVLVLGEAPGRDEARALRPFVGPSGTWLRSALSAANLDPERVAWANVACCWPCRNPVTPTEDEIAACRPNLKATLELARARYILAVGGIASRAMGFEGEMWETRGTWVREGDIWVMSTYHPAYVLRDRGIEKLVRADIEEFSFYSLGVFNPPEKFVQSKGVKVKW